MSDTPRMYSNLTDDEREIVHALDGMSRPEQRAIRLLLGLFREQRGAGVNYPWITKELEATAEAIREMAADLRRLSSTRRRST